MQSKCLVPVFAAFFAAVAIPATGVAQKGLSSYEASVRMADKPLAGVSLRLVSSSDSSAPVTTNREGEATFQVPQGKYHLVTAAPAVYRGRTIVWDVPVEVKGGMLAKLQNKKRLTEYEARPAEPVLPGVRNALVTVLGARGSGSGLLLTQNGVIATSFRLIDDVVGPLVLIDSATKVRARVIAIESTGLALIKVSDRSCQRCAPLARRDSVATWKKGDVVRTLYVDQHFDFKDRVHLVESSDSLGARTQETVTQGLLGAAVIESDGAVSGIVAGDVPARLSSDTSGSSGADSRYQVVHPISRAWQYLAMIDTVEAEPVADTLFPVLAEVLASAQLRVPTPPDKKATVGAWVVVDSAAGWTLSVFGRQWLSNLQGASARMLSKSDPVRPTAIHSAFKDWGNWREYANTSAPVVLVAVTPNLNIGILGQLVSAVVSGKKASKDFCNHSYQSSIGDVHLLRDGVEVLPLDRGRVGLPEYFPGTNACVWAPKEKQVLAVYPAEAFAPHADGTWPKITVEADDLKKNVRRPIVVGAHLMAPIWRNVSKPPPDR